MRHSTSTLCLCLCSILALANCSYNDNYALSFDGEDDVLMFMRSELDYLLVDSWTIEAWIKPTEDQGDRQPNILGFPRRHPNLEYCGPGNSQCSSGALLTQLREANGQYYTITGSPSVQPDQWHHVAGSWDNETLVLYVDGAVDASLNPYQHNFTDAKQCNGSYCDESFQIGGFRLRLDDGGVYSRQYFRGLIDEVRVWKVGRTRQEIISTMNRTLSGNEPGLLYYWRFDEGNGVLVSSKAEYSYGTLGGGLKDAQPKWIPSTAPITLDDPSPDENIPTPATHMLIGALIAVASMIIGIMIGSICGWKVASKKKKNNTDNMWELDPLAAGD